MLNVIMVNAIMLNVVIQNVNMLNVVMLSVIAPLSSHSVKMKIPSFIAFKGKKVLDKFKRDLILFFNHYFFPFNNRCNQIFIINWILKASFTVLTFAAFLLEKSAIDYICTCLGSLGSATTNTLIIFIIFSSHCSKR
jgi:hypothetical protein